jgi:toxin HigB-1
MKTYRVELEKFAQKEFRRLPGHIQTALRTWATLIEEHGIATMRRIPGYHDEPLKGDRQGQRSSRLSQAYRVIYVENEAGELVVVAVLEVNKHDY